MIDWDPQNIDIGGEENKWYGACCDITLDSEEKVGCIPYGVVSSSGWGDGGYDSFLCKKSGKVVGVRIEFMNEEHNERMMMVLAMHQAQ